jgi:hypothetical protein
LVFAHPVTGGVQDSSNLRKRYREIVAAARIDRHVTWHSLRHTFGTSMAASGAPIRAIQAWMGHASITTTEIYADYSPDPSGGVAWAERAFGAGTSPDVPIARGTGAGGQEGFRTGVQGSPRGAAVSRSARRDGLESRESMAGAP